MTMLLPGSTIDRASGKLIGGWDAVLQSLQIIWTTAIGERLMREWFGNPGLRLLGENMTAPVVLRFWQTITIVTELWEPRFSIVRITLIEQTPEEMRLGGIAFDVQGIYRPRGHLGDPTPEGARSLRLGASDGRLLVRRVR